MSDLPAAMVASGGRPFKKHDAERFILCKFRRAKLGESGKISPFGKTTRTARRTIKSRFLRFVVKISPVHKMQNSKFEARIEKFIREETQ